MYQDDIKPTPPGFPTRYYELRKGARPLYGTFTGGIPFRQPRNIQKASGNTASAFSPNNSKSSAGLGTEAYRSSGLALASSMHASGA